MPIKKRLGYKILIRIVWIIIILYTIFIASFVYYRLMHSTAKQQTALMLMRWNYQRPAGINAFPLLWYMGYDIPNEWLNKQMAIDVDKVNRQLAEGLPSIENKPDAVLLPKLSEKEAAMLCDASGKGCLMKVSKNTETVQLILSEHPITLERERALELVDYYWNEFPAYNRYHLFNGFIINIDNAQKVLLSSLALKYIQGDHIDALAATCRNIAAWRRIARGSNSLFGGTILASVSIDSSIRLYADMLLDLPTDAAVPEDCTRALKPIISADVDRCVALAHEFSGIESMLPNGHAISSITNASQINFSKRLYSNIVMSPRLTQAWIAQIFAASCGDYAMKRLLADERPRRQSVLSFLGIPMTKGFACIANIRGCTLINQITLRHQNLDADILDYAAHLRLAATLLWLREHPGGSTEERFEHRPAELRSPNHNSGFNTDRNLLYVVNFRPTRNNKQFELPVVVEK
jgi:hypothetical protein